MLLGELAREGEPLTVSELARRLGRPKSSVSDICIALAHEGLVRREPDGSFQLGARLLELARGFVGGSSVLDAFAAAARGTELADHTLAIVALQQADAVVLDVRLGRRPLPLTPRPGVRAPAWSTAAGRLLLTGLPRERLGPLLRESAADFNGEMPGEDIVLRAVEALRSLSDGAVVEDAGPVVDIAALVGAPVPVVVELKLPAADAERHGTDHLAVAVRDLAAKLGDAD